MNKHQQINNGRKIAFLSIIVTFLFLFGLQQAFAQECTSLPSCVVGSNCVINTACTWTQPTYQFKSLTINAATSRGAYSSLAFTVSDDIFINAPGKIVCPSCAITMTAGRDATCNGDGSTWNIQIQGANGGNGGNGGNSGQGNNHAHFYCEHHNVNGAGNGGGGGGGAAAGSFTVNAKNVFFGSCRMLETGGNGGSGGSGGWGSCQDFCYECHCTGGGSGAAGGAGGAGGSSIFKYVESLDEPEISNSGGAGGSGGSNVYIASQAFCLTIQWYSGGASAGGNGAAGTKTATPISASQLSSTFTAQCQTKVGSTNPDLFFAELPFSQACCGDDGIINPGFEVDTNWDLATSGASLSMPTEKPHSGTRSLKSSYRSSTGATELTSGRRAISNLIPVTPNTDYMLVGWIYRTKEAKEANAYIDTGDLPYGEECEAWAKGTETWEFVNCKFKTSSTRTSMKIGAVIDGVVKGNVFFDDIHILGVDQDAGRVASDSVNNEYVCAHDGTTWGWKSAPTNNYVIRNAGYSYNLISNNKEWFACNVNNALTVLSAPNTFTGAGIPPPDEEEFSFDSGTSGVFFGPAGGGTSGPDAEAIDQESILSSVGNIVVITENAITEQGVSFTTAPIEVRFGKITLKVTGLPSNYWIRNSSGLRIKIVQDDAVVPTWHQEIQADASGAIKKFNITLPFDTPVGVYGLNVTILKPDNTIYKSYLLQDAFLVTDAFLVNSFNPFQVNTERFLCTNETTPTGRLVGSIFECCGPSQDYCLNGERNNTRVSGSPTSLVKDFYGTSFGNTVLRVNFPKTTAPKYQFDVKDLAITNWSAYDSLEFDILFTGSKKLNLLINTTSSISTTPLYGAITTLVPGGDQIYTVQRHEAVTATSSSNSIRGYVFKTKVPGTVPLYRTFNQALSDYKYTTSLTEATSGGYQIQKVEAYVYPPTVSPVPAGTTALKRIYKATSPQDNFYRQEPVGTVLTGYAVMETVAYVYAAPTSISVPAFDDAVIKYSLTGTGVNKWHHIKIPLTDFLKRNVIRSFKFYVGGNELRDDVGSNYIDLNGVPKLMVFGIDRIVLSSEDTRYCATDPEQPDSLNGASNVGRWVDDLDTDRDACNAVPSFRWTSEDSQYDDEEQTHCCGDDQGKQIITSSTVSTTPVTVSPIAIPLINQCLGFTCNNFCAGLGYAGGTQTGFVAGLTCGTYTCSCETISYANTPSADETYRDVNGGCWKGMFMPNNTVVPASANP
jgi:hypothetical protein